MAVLLYYCLCISPEKFSLLIFSLVSCPCTIYLSYDDPTQVSYSCWIWKAHKVHVLQWLTPGGLAQVEETNHLHHHMCQ